MSKPEKKIKTENLKQISDSSHSEREIMSDESHHVKTNNPIINKNIQKSKKLQNNDLPETKSNFLFL
jgi:hypothetical protein